MPFVIGKELVSSCSKHAIPISCIQRGVDICIVIWTKVISAGEEGKMRRAL